MLYCFAVFAVEIQKANTMDMCFLYLFATATLTLLSVVVGEKCGYVYGPLASTNDTVVINLNCNQSTPSSHYVPLQLRDNATHVAVQLLHCHMVPVGLFTNVTDNLTSVTVASEDAVQLLEGTFEGLGHVTELRLLGFTKLENLSRSVLEPLRNIQTLILDGFGRSNIKMSAIGSAIQGLKNTPINRLVLNDIPDYFSTKLLDFRTMRLDDFKIINTSVKEVIISSAPVHYVGSIRLAFPHLTCFHGSVGNVPTQESLPVMWDLTLLSNTLKEFILCRYKNLPPTSNLQNLTAKEIFAIFRRTLIYYPDLLKYFLNRPAAEDCAMGFQLTLGANLSSITINGIKTTVENVQKPFCIDKNNNLEYLDLTASPLPRHFSGIRGLTKLKYLSLANTRIKSLSDNFLQYYPALEILKLGKLDIGKFIKSIDRNFFVSSPALTEIHLDNCQLTDISTALISALINFQHNWTTNTPTFTENLEYDFRNRTNLKLLNFSSNYIRSVSQNSIGQLNQLALGGQKESSLFIDLSYNDIHCLCNSTYFIQWLTSNSGMTFPGFDSYTCLYPNGSIVLVSEVTVSELQQHCNVIQTLVNGSDCPCDEDLRRRLQQVWVHLHGFFCRNGDGDLVPMQNQPFPSCFNPYLRASFIAPVVVGGIFGIAVFVTVGLLIYHRNSRRVKQVRECLHMNPVHFVRTALEYMMMQNHEHESASFRYDMFVLVHDDEQNGVPARFLEALERDRRVTVRDDIPPGNVSVEAMLEYISACRWIVPVLTSKFVRDRECLDFVSRVQAERPHSLIPVVWEQPGVVSNISIQDLLRNREPLYWPGDLAAPGEKRNFWSSLLERTIPLP